MSNLFEFLIWFSMVIQSILIVPTFTKREGAKTMAGWSYELFEKKDVEVEHATFGDILYNKGSNRQEINFFLSEQKN